MKPPFNHDFPTVFPYIFPFNGLPGPTAAKSPGPKLRSRPAGLAGQRPGPAGDAGGAQTGRRGTKIWQNTTETTRNYGNIMETCDLPMVWDVPSIR